MKLVVDANVLFSCLVKKGLTRQLWFDSALRLYSPEFITIEFLKHKVELRAKFGGSDEEFNNILQRSFRCLKIISDTELVPFLPAAASLIADKKDWLYLACALKEGADMWTRDKGFQGQKRVRIWTTEELAKEIGTL